LAVTIALSAGNIDAELQSVVAKQGPHYKFLVENSMVLWSAVVKQFAYIFGQQWNCRTKPRNNQKNAVE